MDPDVKRELSSSKIRLRSKSPYFSVLVNYLKPVQSQRVPTAAVDGKRLFVNREFWLSLKPVERDFVLVHEVLHCALKHCSRRGWREPLRWNVACDYVVNLIAKDATFNVLPQALLDEKYRKMTADEVYHLLPEDLSEVLGGGSPFLDGDVLTGEDAKEVEAHWRAAIAQANAVNKAFGKDPLGEVLAVDLERSEVDWRTVLWRELTAGSSDFTEWDQRLVSDELFVEEIQPEEIPNRACIYVDSSGSMLGKPLGHACGEVLQIASLYGDKGMDLYFGDTELIGPLKLSEARNPIGGGGTSFVPIFEEVEKKKYKVIILISDLDGSYPDHAPKDCRVVWIVPPGNRVDVPFGQVVKILG